MNARSITFRLLVILIVLSISATSCTLPFKIVPNVATTEPGPVATTPPPPIVATTELPSETLTPLPLLEALLPVTGSILRWVDYSDFVFVPEGEFVMGQDESNESDHAPAHPVTLTGFWIHQAEVTNGQYTQCVAAGECTPPSREPDTDYWYGFSSKVNYPVVGVTWFQAQEYCTYIDARLPTEAEWEKTARGLSDAPYPWGTGEPDCSLLNYNDCLDPSEPEEVRNYNNGTSDYEAMDLSGNVFEWVADWYAEDYYAISPAANPQGPADGLKKVYRGGSYPSSLEEVNAIVRFSAKPEEHSAELGFRCVLIGEGGTMDGGGSVGRPCEVVQFEPQQPVSGPTKTPYPCAAPSIGAFCERKPAGAVVGITISQADCLGNHLKDILGNGLPLTCTTTGTNPVHYLCTGGNLAQGALINIDYCHKFTYQVQAVNCPQGYHYNDASTFCEPDGQWLPDPPCGPGYIEKQGACFPLYDGSCPVGFYKVQENNTTFCVPLDDCLLPGGEPCEVPVCAPGQTYDPQNACCSVPPKLQQVCPIGYVYSDNPKGCFLTSQYPDPCGMGVAQIPYCPTITPSPTAPPPINCSIYTDQGICKSMGCDWGGIANGYCY